MAEWKKVQLGGLELKAFLDDGVYTLAVQNSTYNTIRNQEVIAGTAAGTIPAQAGQLHWFRAAINNAGKIYLGGSGVTAPDGTADATTGIELSAGDVWGPIPLDNASQVYHIASAAAQQFFVTSLDN